jgi:hypothetical protein
MSRTKRVIKAGKLTATTASGKTKIKGSALSIANAGKPAFGLASINQQRNGTWKTVVKCINGNSANQFELVLPKDSCYADGKPLPSTAELMVVFPDFVNIDLKKLYPFDAGSNPAFQKGGIGKGEIKEGAQDPGRQSDPNKPVQFPLLTTYWVNGAAYKVTVMMKTSLGLTLFPGDEVFFDYIMDDRGEFTVVSMAKSEGNCPTVGPVETSAGTDPSLITE